MNKKIASTIWNQMRMLDSNLCMCMGVCKLQVIENGLQFQVTGISFRGLIQITLNGGDLYDIKFIKPNRNQDPIAKQLGLKRFTTSYDVKKEFNDVFADQLMDVLEEVVENRNK